MALLDRLRDRRTEIEQAALTRVHAISDPATAQDPDYPDSLRAAVSAAIDYGLAAAEHGEEGAPPIPAGLLAHARVSARNGFTLDTVLRRYFAGYTLLSDHLIEAASEVGLRDHALQRVVRGHAALFDRLLAAVSQEYRLEVESRPTGSEQRRGERIEQLLDGELLDVSGLAAELAYEFEAFHVGLVASGHQVVDFIRDLPQALDCRALVVRREVGTVWAWLGARRELDYARLASLARRSRFALAVGESAEGLIGWRLTHRQAKAALPVALRSPQQPVRYADVAVLASVLRDDLLTGSLRRHYLTPLEAGRGGGEIALGTLRAYFAAERNISSTAAALGVSRNTIANRLRAIEASLGARLAEKGLDLEIALRLTALESGSHGESPRGDVPMHSQRA